MKYSKLGNTEIEVSKICLGTMTWGEQNSMEDAHKQLDYSFDQGVNFIDTAEMYPVPPSKETFTKTESYIGNWTKLREQRDKIIVATKVSGPMPSFEHIRNGKGNFKKETLEEALNDSLKRMKLDYVDLYQLHWPERHTNYFGQLEFSVNEEIDKRMTPFEEVLETLEKMKKSGKIRSFGLSNETSWGVMKFLELSARHDLIRPVSVQNPYNLLNRSYEISLSEVSYRENVGLLAYSPLAFGVLTGKYLDGQKPEGARLTLWDRFSRYSSVQAQSACAEYVDLAKRHSLSSTQLALAFINKQFFVCSNIIGATNMKQLKENIDAIDVELSDQIIDEINLIHQKNTNPCP